MEKKKYNKCMKRSYIKQVGKVGRKTNAAVAKWRKLNPPNHQGYYICYLCGCWVAANQMQVEHVKSKARHPDLRADLSNFKPACSRCNAKKGSYDA